MREWVRSRLQYEGERGSSAPTLIVLLAVPLVLALGIVIDGASKYQADQQATATAQSAARAAVNAAASPELPGSGSVELSAGQAITSGNRYLAAAGMDGTVVVNGTTVTVTARKTINTKFLSMITPTLTGEGTGSAELRSGP